MRQAKIVVDKSIRDIKMSDEIIDRLDGIEVAAKMVGGYKCENGYYDIDIRKEYPFEDEASLLRLRFDGLDLKVKAPAVVWQLVIEEESATYIVLSIVEDEIRYPVKKVMSKRNEMGDYQAVSSEIHNDRELVELLDEILGRM